MKTLRRPMFRKGGNVGTGVMTGIVDRGNYANGNLSVTLNEDDIQERVDSYRGNQQQSSDPLTDFLLQFGPNLLSQKPSGSGFRGLLSTVGEASKGPIKDLITNKRSQRSEDIALRAKAIDALGQDDLKKIRAQAKVSLGPQLETETSEEYASRLQDKMAEFIDSTYAKSPFLKTDSPEEKIFDYANTMVKTGDMKDMPTAKNRSNFELNDYDRLRAAKVNIQLPRAKKIFNKKNDLKRNVNQGVYYDDITDTYTRVVVNEKGQLEAIKNITFEELIQN